MSSATMPALRAEPEAPRREAGDTLAGRYDERAGVYRDLWAPILEVADRRLVHDLATATRGPVRDVLDLGTGTGVLLPHLRSAFRGAEITGVDSSPGMLALAPAGFRRAVMDARDLELPRASFDLVTAAFMLFHLIPPIDGVREARRVLRTGGRFAALTWESMIHTEADRTWSACLDELGAVAPDPLPSSQGELDTPEKVRTLLESAGFVAVDARVEKLEVGIPRNGFLRLRSMMGPEIGRFRSLDSAGRLRCVLEADRRLTRLPDSAFTFRGTVVRAVGTAG